MQNRAELAKHFAALGFKYGAEVGVFRGDYSAVLCESIPNLKLLCVDSWFKYAGYNDVRNQAALDQAYEFAKNRLLNYNALIIRDTSANVVADLPDESLDFVFIDAGHDRKNVEFDIREWTKKVRIGGIVSGHDYWHISFPDVTLVVDEYVNANAYALQVTSFDMVNPSIVERQPCWYFEKNHA